MFLRMAGRMWICRSRFGWPWELGTQEMGTRKKLCFSITRWCPNARGGKKSANLIQPNAVVDNDGI